MRSGGKESLRYSWIAATVAIGVLTGLVFAFLYPYGFFVSDPPVAGRRFSKSDLQVTRQLRMDGWSALSIHGDKSQEKRDWVLSEFRSGKSPIMTATDVAAHGLDMKDVKFVINYDFPGSLEDYAHQIGHTRRVGAKGTAYTFFTTANARFAKELIGILEEAGQKISTKLAARGRGGAPPPPG